MLEKRTIKSIIYSGAVILGTASLLAVMQAFSKKAPPVEQQERTYLVHALEVDIGSIRPRISVFGTVEARDQVVLSSPVVSEVLATPFLEGMSFAEGERLVRLDLRDLNFRREDNLAAAEEIVAQMDGLESETRIERTRLAETESLLELSRKQFERSERLYAQKVIPEAQLEETKANLKQTEIEHLAAQQRLLSLETQHQRLAAQKRRIDSQRGQLDILIERAQVRAPFSGTVLGIDVSPGKRVTEGTQLIEVFAPDSLVVRASIPNRHLEPLAQAGNPEVVVTGPSQELLTLGVDFLRPEIREDRGSAEAIIKLPKRQWVLGSVTNVDIILDQVPGSVAVPYEALYANNRIFRIDGDLRAQGVDCEQIGFTGGGEGSNALLKCADLKSGDLVVAQQVPNLATGFKLRLAN